MKSIVSPRLFVLTIIVFLLLLLYVAILGEGILTLICLHGSADPVGQTCFTKYKNPFESLFGAIGGLVSAVVVAALAIKPSDKRISLLYAFGNRAAPSESDWVTWIYVGVWLALGAIAFVLVWSLGEGYRSLIAIAWLSEYSKTYFGTLLGAGYAFFGLSPVSPPN